MDRETGGIPGRTIDKSSITETPAHGVASPLVFKSTDFDLSSLNEPLLEAERTRVEPPTRLERFLNWVTNPWVAGTLASGAALSPAVAAAHTEYAQVAGVTSNSPYVLEGLERDEQRIENRQPLSDSDSQLRSSLTTALTGGAPVEIAEPNGNSKFVVEYMPAPDTFEVKIQSANVDQAKTDAISYFKAQGVSDVCNFPVVISLAPDVAARMVSLGQQFDPSIAECQQASTPSSVETTPNTDSVTSSELGPSKQVTRFDQVLQNSGVNLDDRDKEILKGPLSSELGKEPTTDLAASSSFIGIKEPSPNVKIYSYAKDGYGQFSVALNNGKVVYMDIPLGLLSRSQNPFTIVKTEIGMGVDPSSEFRTLNGGEAYAWPEQGLIIVSEPSKNPGVGDLVDRAILITPMSTASFNDTWRINLSLHGIPNLNQ